MVPTSIHRLSRLLSVGLLGFWSAGCDAGTGQGVSLHEEHSRAGSDGGAEYHSKDAGTTNEDLEGGRSTLVSSLKHGQASAGDAGSEGFGVCAQTALVRCYSECEGELECVASCDALYSGNVGCPMRNPLDGELAPPPLEAGRPCGTPGLRCSYPGLNAGELTLAPECRANFACENGVWVTDRSIFSTECGTNSCPNYEPVDGQACDEAGARCQSFDREICTCTLCLGAGTVDIGAPRELSWKCHDPFKGVPGRHQDCPSELPYSGTACSETSDTSRLICRYDQVYFDATCSTGSSIIAICRGPDWTWELSGGACAE